MLRGSRETWCDPRLAPETRRTLGRVAGKVELDEELDGGWKGSSEEVAKSENSVQ